MNWIEKHADQLGIAAALLCAIHCMAFPLLILLRSQISESLHDHWHWADFVFLGIGFVSVLYASRKACSKQIRVLLWVAFALLAGAVFFEDPHSHSHSLNYAAMGAALLLISIHIRNIWEHHRSRRSVRSYR